MTTKHQFEFRVMGVEQPLLVSSFVGEERISGVYLFDVLTATSRIPQLGANALVGQEAALTIRSERHPPRVIRGVIAQQEILGHQTHLHRLQVRFRLVPHLWLLRRRRQSRIFQELSIVQIVNLILSSYSIQHKWTLDRVYNPLEYCVQYQETDLAFIQRILAEHGIHYFFVQPAEATSIDWGTTGNSVGTLDGMQGTLLEVAPDSHGIDNTSLWSYQELVVFNDNVRGYLSCGAVESIGAPITQDTDFGAQYTNHITSLQYRNEHISGGEILNIAFQQSLRAHRAVVRGFDFYQPRHHPEQVTRTDTGSIATIPDALNQWPLEIYEHHGQYCHPQIDRRSARQLLERERNKEQQVQGKSIYPILSPGHKFELHNYPLDELNRSYMVTKLRHEGHVPELSQSTVPTEFVYINRFECLTSNTMFLPKVVGKRPQQTLETATVVSEPDDEIQTDLHARVKVRFHWDRSAPVSAHMTCWLRVSQQWAGAGRGTQFIPRKDDEVLVAFLEGDTDRPVIVGSLYNGVNSPPFALPMEKTRSGLRTFSGLGAYNELSFNDVSGAEQVYIRAQHELREDVLGDHNRDVIGNESVVVHSNQSLQVQKSREENISENAKLHVHGNYTVDVNGANRLNNHGSFTIHTMGRQEEHVLGSRFSYTRGLANYSYDQSVVYNYKADVSINADQNLSMVSSGRAELIGGAGFDIASLQEVFLYSGRSFMSISPEGIELSASKITLKTPKAEVQITPEKVFVIGMELVEVAAPRVLIVGERATVEVGAIAQVRAPDIKLSSSTERPFEELLTQAIPTRIKLKDQAGHCVGKQVYRVQYKNGNVRSGVLDENGEAELTLEDAAEIIFGSFDGVVES